MIAIEISGSPHNQHKNKKSKEGQKQSNAILIINFQKIVKKLI